MSDLSVRATAIFGVTADGIRWPYDVSGIDRTLRYRDPEAHERKMAELTTKRYTIVEWAEHHGLTKSSINRCCPLWLTRTTSRRCTRGSACQISATPDRPWLDHDIYWLRDGRPAVITSAPYEVSEDDTQRLLWWRTQHRALRVERGTGWYGYGTTQIVLWNTSRIKYVSPAHNIDRPETFMGHSHD